MRFAIDAWDPGYGSSLELDGAAETVVQVRTDIELPVDRWVPIPPTPGLEQPSSTVFVDGVRRVEARAWIDDVDPDDPDLIATEATPALCASYAAGAVCCCDDRAHFLTPELRRGLFTTSDHARDIDTWAGIYQAWPVTLKPAQGLMLSLSATLQHRLTELELLVAVNARSLTSDHTDNHANREDSLLIVDGPVRGRAHLTRVLGVIKSHQTAYLEPRLHAMVSRLAAGERTPVFLVDTSWDRFTWYLRLPGEPSHPWSGIIRVECAANIPAAEAIALARLSQAVLPRYASVEYKDPRAPQNLYPVAALERELRRRLGHPALLARALRQAAHPAHA